MFSPDARRGFRQPTKLGSTAALTSITAAGQALGSTKRKLNQKNKDGPWGGSLVSAWLVPAHHDRIFKEYQMSSSAVYDPTF